MTTAAAPESNATAMPAYAKDRRNINGKTNNTASDPATARALPPTVRPARTTVRRTAASVS